MSLRKIYSKLLEKKLNKPNVGHVTQSPQYPQITHKSRDEEKRKTELIGITWCCFVTRNISKMFTSCHQPRTSNYSIFLRSEAESTLRRKNKNTKSTEIRLARYFKIGEEKNESISRRVKKAISVSPTELKYRRVVSWFYSAFRRLFLRVLLQMRKMLRSGFSLSRYMEK